jgi:geranylgeranyl pyrophosphate synthase
MIRPERFIIENRRRIFSSRICGEHRVKERCHKILEKNGGIVADRARTILLEDPTLKDLRPPLEFVSKNWRDPLTPSLMGLSCEAVGGRSDVTYQAALAMSLMNLSFYVWDDMVDKAPSKLFKPTLYGKFGEGAALVIGGLASAKAFSILSQMNLDETKRQAITNLFWNLWAKIAKAETVNLRLRRQRDFSPRKKLWVIKMHASDLETCLRIGAVLGNGSEDEVKHLGRYGLYLGIILELWKDFHVSINLTLSLADKIRSGALPYSLRWARERCEKIRKKLEDLTNRNTVRPSDIKEVVEHILETKALNNTMKTIRKFTNKAGEEVFKLKENKATRTLKFFVEAQPQLFIESLSTLQV